MSTGDSPKVSVCIIAYNQAKFIRQCLDSVIAQRTNFPFEVVVGDDASTDGTREIIADYASRYPHTVRALLHKTNIGGGVQNYLSVHAAARGIYVAHVDGDDFCLPGKLQYQADILDSDPSCNIVFHRVLALLPDGALHEGGLWNVANLESRRFDRAALLRLMALGVHSSKMYRRPKQEVKEPSFPLLDYFLHVEHVGLGVARFTGTKPLGVHRVGGGLSKVGGASRNALAKTLLHFAKKYPAYRREVNTAALTMFLVDLRHQRWSWPMFGRVWLRTFHPGSVLLMAREWPLIKQLGLDSGVLADVAENEDRA
jgi:glycosyltransferase involved in cell wall biosynthesis